MHLRGPPGVPESAHLVSSDANNIYMRANMRPAADGMAWTGEFFEDTLAKTETDEGGGEAKYGWVVKPWLTDVERQFKQLERAPCEGASERCSNARKCEQCDVARTLQRTTYTSDCVNQLNLANTSGYCVLSHTRGKPVFLMDELEVEIRIPMTALELQNELDCIQMDATVRIFGGQQDLPEPGIVQEIRLDLSEAFNKVQVKIHGHPK